MSAQPLATRGTTTTLTGLRPWLHTLRVRVALGMLPEYTPRCEPCGIQFSCWHVLIFVMWRKRFRDAFGFRSRSGRCCSPPNHLI